MYLFITSIYVIYIVLFLKLTSQEGHDDDVVLDKIALRSCSPVKSNVKVTELWTKLTPVTSLVSRSLTISILKMFKIKNNKLIKQKKKIIKIIQL